MVKSSMGLNWVSAFAWGWCVELISYMGMWKRFYMYVRCVSGFTITGFEQAVWKREMVGNGLFISVALSVLAGFLSGCAGMFVRRF